MISSFYMSRVNYSLAVGNVLVVVSDRKKGTTDNGSSVYVPEIVSYSDYSPFGTQLHLRHGSSEGYRYGFNGMEKDDEVKGAGNSYDYGARFYDPRIGRWLSVDNIVKVDNSPYQGSRNNQIIFLDPDGNDDIYFMHNYWWYKKNGQLKRVTDGQISHILPIADKIYSKSGVHHYYQVTSTIVHSEIVIEKISWRNGYLKSKDELKKELLMKIEDGKKDLQTLDVEVGDWFKYSDGTWSLEVTYKYNDHKIVEINSPRTIMGGDIGQDGYGERTNKNFQDAVSSVIKDFVKEYGGGRSGVVSDLSSKFIKGIMKESNGGGLLDFKTTLGFDDNILYQINGVFYNRNEAGNFYWGFAMASFGFDWNHVELMANEGTKILDPRRAGDENWELDAIRDGWDHYTKNKHTNNIEMYENH